MSNLFGFGRGVQIYKEWTNNGCKKWGDAAKIGKNNHLLVMVRVRLLQKIGIFDLTGWA